MSSAPYSSRTYLSSMNFPPVDDIDPLLGKSNFHSWRSLVQPILLTNSCSSNLIIGDWTEPDASSLPNPANEADKDRFDQARREWHTANTATCRFIRATLAMNVTPFVRQHQTAKALFFNLIWLYGDEAGIDTQGGPSVPGNAKLPSTTDRNTHSGSLQKNRASLLAALKDGEANGVLEYLGPDISPTAATSSLNASSTSLPLRTAVKGKDPIPQQQTVASAPPPAPLTRIHIYERTRISPSPSLETIHEEPHPGRRVSFGRDTSRSPDDGVRSRSISPLTLSDMSSGVYDNEDLDTFDDSADHAQPRVKRGRKKGNRTTSKDDGSGAGSGIMAIFGSAGKDKGKKREKSSYSFSFSFPLRRLGKDRYQGN